VLERGSPAKASCSLDAATSAWVREVAARSGANVSAVILAASAALVHRLTGHEELTVVPPPEGVAPTLRVRRDARLVDLVPQGAKAAPSFAFDDRVQPRLELALEDRGAELELTATTHGQGRSGHGAELLLEQLEALIRRSSQDPGAAVGACSLVTASTAGRLPDPRTPLPVSPFAPVTDEIAALAGRSPEAVAVASGNAHWAYADLGAAAREGAEKLVTHGVEPGEVVAVSGGPSFALVAAIVGTLAAGAVLLPVDPALPARRKELLYAKARAAHLVIAAPETLVIDRLPDAQQLVPPPDPPAVAVEPAYLVFTSGTTGSPQAVLGHHAGLSHFVAWQRERWAVGPGDRVAHVTSLSFDVVLRELFLPLTSGATLCLPERLPLEPGSVLRWLLEERVSVLHAVPTLARVWLDSAPPDTVLPDLRLTFFAGEPLTADLVHAWRKRAPRSTVVNLYGPSETTLAKCFFVVPDQPEPGIQPIGRPLPATQALVLSPEGELCGVGEPGEIVLRTPFRTFGYLDAPELQRERFRRNPFTDDVHDLLYASGDVGRYRADGSLDIFGRVDEQVKIRGVRVEPREVAAVLQRHPGVHDAAIVARPGPELVAYVVSTEPAAELRSFLRERLPAAAVPTSFVSLPSLPYTSNGKLDVAALAEPPAAVPRSTLVEPRDDVERGVLAIWSEVLGREDVGPEDDFFDLGGESLALLRVAARLYEMFGCDLSLEEMFDHPTARELAERVRAAEAV